MRRDLPSWHLVVPGRSRGAAVSQNLDGFLGTFVLGSHQQKLAAMRECHRVGLNNFIWQPIVGQMGLECPDDGLVIWFTTGGCFGRPPNDRRRRTWRKDHAKAMRFSSDNSFVENGVLEADARQAGNRLIHVTGIVKNGDNCCH